MMNTARHLTLFALAVLATLVLVASGAHGASTFTVNTQRFDPYKSYRFLLLMDGKPVAGMTDVNFNTVSPRDAASGLATGKRMHKPITFVGSVTQDSDFWKWLKNARDAGSAKDLTIILRDEAGNPVQRFTIKRAWVSETSALPDLDAGGNAIAIEHIKLENEGWEQDTLTPEPKDK